jgi:hypothetical protein
MSTPSLWVRIKGVVGSFFQLGGPAGPGLNGASPTAIEAKDATNTVLVNLRAAPPLVDTDVATKAYVDTTSNATPVSQQFNGGSTLPSNSSTEQWYVVTTAGTGGAAAAVIGAILWDDGSGAGVVKVIAPSAGKEIVTTASFTGGAISFNANQNYVWSGTAWVNISPNVSGAVYEVSYALGLGAAQSSVTQIPSGARVTNVLLTVTPAYSAGTTISIGETGSTSLLMATGDNFPTVPGIYSASQDTPWPSLGSVLATVTGAPSAGAATVTVQYAMPTG